MRVYADTSVFGGVYDEEFTAPSRAFFERVRAGRFELVVSPLVAEEITDAPEPVRELFDQIIRMRR
jgi:predicted nucleic acid-binding protein